MKNSIYISGIISAIGLTVGALFKILPWPGAGIMVLVALLAPFIIFLPAYIFYYNKTTNKDITNFIAILFLLFFVALMDAFLAIGVSKNIIDYTVQINQTTNQINTVLEGKNEMMYENLPSSQPGLLDAQQTVNLKTRTKELCNLIDEMKFSLVIAAGKNNEFYISDSGDINLWKIKGKDNQSLATGKFLYTDEARILKNQIEVYKEYVKSLNVKKINFDLDEVLNVDDINKNDQSKAWENALFEGSIMVWAIQKLDMIKMKVKMVESEVLTTDFITG